MAFCGACGHQVADGVKFCPACGAAIGAAAPAQQPVQQAAPVQQPVQQAAPQQAGAQQNGGAQQKSNDLVNKITNTKDFSADFDANDIETNKIMAVLSYLGILFFIPILAAPNSKYARFHANQGICLFGGWIASGIIMGIFTFLKFIFLLIVDYGVLYTIFAAVLNLVVGVISFAVFVLAILGIINAFNGKAKELPLIGRFRILK